MQCCCTCPACLPARNTPLHPSLLVPVAVMWAMRMRYAPTRALPGMLLPLQSVLVEEPGPEEALAWLQGLAPRYASHHGVAFTHAALETAVRCAKR